MKKVLLVLALFATLSGTAFAVGVTYNDHWDSGSAGVLPTVDSNWTTGCAGGSSCGGTDWSITPASGAGCGSLDCWVVPRQARFSDYDRSTALVNYTGDGSHMEDSIDITGQINPDNPCPDPNPPYTNWCVNGMNAGLVLNSTSPTTLNNFVACKLEITPYDRPNGLLAIIDWQNGIYTGGSGRQHVFTGSSMDKLNIGTQYHLTFYRTTNGGTYGTYTCTVTGPDINSQSVSWVADNHSGGEPTFNAGTYYGLRAKVANDANDQEDSGATRFDNYELKIH